MIHDLPLKASAPTLLERAGMLWARIGTPGRIALIVLLALLLLWLAVLVLRRVGRAGLRGILWGTSGASLVGLLVFGVWSFRLPDNRIGVFEAWQQVVRVGAAMSATLFVVGVMGLAIPHVFNRLEQSGFTSMMAVRHVRTGGRHGFLSVISILSMAGVGVSAFALCAVISIMGGFGADLKRKILGNNAHVRIEAPSVGGFADWEQALERVRKAPGVSAASPVAAGEAMASSSSNTAGLLLRGIDAATIRDVIELGKNIEVGRFEFLEQPARLLNLPPEEAIGIGTKGQVFLKGPDYPPTGDMGEGSPPELRPGIILGRELARSLHVFVGDEVTLVSPLGDLGPMGVLPRSRTFRVAAIFYSGMYEYDASHAYVLLSAAQEFLDLGKRITGIDVRVSEAERADAIAPAVKSALGRSELTVRHWQEMNKNLFSALKLEKIATFIILSIAIAVASFCIICTLLLMVTEKSREIAILKALGASDRAILRVFMTEGVIIGTIGTVFGILTGWVAMGGLERFGVRLDPEVYYVDRLPILVDWRDYALVAVAALVITTLATIYPALAASQLRPVDGIRYE
jgi:lipoprotein-releasing system permease protein